MTEQYDNQQQQIVDVPIITIERDDEIPADGGKKRTTWSYKWMIAAILLAFGLFLAWLLWNDSRTGIAVSVSERENISKLQQPMPHEEAGIEHTSDSVLGVAMDFYAIHGVVASIEFEEPDTADATVFLYSRSADHKASGEYLGTLVVNGRQLSRDRARLGYMAMSGENQVIGVGKSERISRYVRNSEGSLFRQFVLVSNYEVPTYFALHGKVERRAIGRIGNTLYYIATRHKETMWDFADALREYGFVDAIYITGGTDYSYYRNSDGSRHDIGDIARYPHQKWQGIIPWLVFRKVE